MGCVFWEGRVGLENVNLIVFLHLIHCVMVREDASVFIYLFFAPTIDQRNSSVERNLQFI